MICDAIDVLAAAHVALGLRMAVRTDRFAALFPGGDVIILGSDHLDGVTGDAPAGCSPSQAWPLMGWSRT